MVNVTKISCILCVLYWKNIKKNKLQKYFSRVTRLYLIWPINLQINDYKISCLAQGFVVWKHTLRLKKGNGEKHHNPDLHKDIPPVKLKQCCLYIILYSQLCLRFKVLQRLIPWVLWFRRCHRLLGVQFITQDFCSKLSRLQIKIWPLRNYSSSTLRERWSKLGK